MTVRALRTLIENHFLENRRELPWRTPTLQLDQNSWLDPYPILVSELMLQQTQVSRVVSKYDQFIKELPTIAALASAPLSLVLELWSGLGYNRRAKYLHDAARMLVDMPSPWQPADLTAIKGIGPNTAAAICVYAFNQPHVFIETNIRSVFIHHLQNLAPPSLPTGRARSTAGLLASDVVAGSEAPSPYYPYGSVRFSPAPSQTLKRKVSGGIRDEELLPLIKRTLDRENPRDFYWALMDYGAYLKRTATNPSRASAHHARQPAFAGSQRQLRGQVVRYLLAVRSASKVQLADAFPDERLEGVLDTLVREGLFAVKGTTFSVVAS